MTGIHAEGGSAPLPLLLLLHRRCCVAMRSHHRQQHLAEPPPKERPLTRQKAAGNTRTSPQRVPGSFFWRARPGMDPGEGREKSGRCEGKARTGGGGDKIHMERGGKEKGGGEMCKHTERRRGLTSGDLTRAAGLRHASPCPPASPTASRLSF